MQSIQNGKPRTRLFGTDGIRGVVGDLYTPAFVVDIASAYGTCLGPPGTVLIGQDFRTTSWGISHLLAGTLQMLGFDAVEMGPMPTPCFQYNVRCFEAKGGLMVTASHNPPEYNGIKFTGPRGLEILPEMEARIATAYADRAFNRANWKTTGTIRSESSGIDRYLASIHAHTDSALIRRAHPTVVLDPGNGTSAVTSPRLLREMGCRLLTLNDTPDGWFPGRLSEPSEANLTQLAEAVPKMGGGPGHRPRRGRRPGCIRGRARPLHHGGCLAGPIREVRAPPPPRRHRRHEQHHVVRGAGRGDAGGGQARRHPVRIPARRPRDGTVRGDVRG
ncbi:phospho-sugar mutase [mine drainage metagenome]|uniref:Phospho-sugar mutase n=1 Tax=mine drainage metagenome TaxID=410659 RepID=T1AI34_9ZZZZ